MSDLIDRLSELRCQYNCFDENERDAYHTLSEAIKALSDVPDTNVGDTISRQAAINEIEGVDWYHQNKKGEMVHGANSKEHQPWYKSQDIYKALKAVPAVDAVPVVRCEYCRWGREVCGNIECFVDSNIPPEYHGYEWFCPNGERRK